ncbi:DNA/RNA helicase domain-containing protein [Corynebacterium sanguinis]
MTNELVIRGKFRTEVRSFDYSAESLRNFLAYIRDKGDSVSQRLLLNFPTVYIVYTRTKQGFHVYVGETNDIAQRTTTHLSNDPRLADSELAGLVSDDPGVNGVSNSVRRSQTWRLFRDRDSKILVIGHSLFNKSMTLEVEDRLMLYLAAIDDVVSAEKRRVFLNNARRNVQTEYFTRDYVDDAFTNIWMRLREREPELIPIEQLVRDSALFKASPFHQLNAQQVGAKLAILDSVEAAIKDAEGPKSDQSQLILVQGGAGTGKTVLLSSVFYDLAHLPVDPDSPTQESTLDVYMLVNHDEQITVYTQIAERLGLSAIKNPRVMKPTRFINSHQAGDQIADVVLVDEAHLLWTQGKQSYRGENQLKDILELARVVVAVFDPNQVLAGNQYWNEDDLRALRERAGEENCLQLDQQMRIDSEGPAEEWIHRFVHGNEVLPIPTNDKYQIQVFGTPEELHEAVKARSKTEGDSQIEKGLSRLIATYDWKFSNGKTKPKDGATWDVVIGDFRLPWNNQQKGRKNSSLSWAEREHSIDEVGSIFTIQGFDLNFAGVILGPSVIYRNGRVQFDPEASMNPNVRNRRGEVVNGKKVMMDVSESLLRNQLNVLMTRGVRGMGIYAVDAELREALIRAQRDGAIL